MDSSSSPRSLRRVACIVAGREEVLRFEAPGALLSSHDVAETLMSGLIEAGKIYPRTPGNFQVFCQRPTADRDFDFQLTFLCLKGKRNLQSVNLKDFSPLPISCALQNWGNAEDPVCCVFIQEEMITRSALSGMDTESICRTLWKLQEAEKGEANRKKYKALSTAKLQALSSNQDESQDPLRRVALVFETEQQTHFLRFEAQRELTTGGDIARLVLLGLAKDGKIGFRHPKNQKNKANGRDPLKGPFFKPGFLGSAPDKSLDFRVKMECLVDGFDLDFVSINDTGSGVALKSKLLWDPALPNPVCCVLAYTEPILQSMAANSEKLSDKILTTLKKLLEMEKNNYKKSKFVKVNIGSGAPSSSLPRVAWTNESPEKVSLDIPTSNDDDDFPMVPPPPLPLIPDPLDGNDAKSISSDEVKSNSPLDEENTSFFRYLPPLGEPEKYTALQEKEQIFQAWNLNKVVIHVSDTSFSFSPVRLETQEPITTFSQLHLLASFALLLNFCETDGHYFQELARNNATEVPFPYPFSYLDLCLSDEASFSYKTICVVASSDEKRLSDFKKQALIEDEHDLESPHKYLMVALPALASFEDHSLYYKSVMAELERVYKITHAAIPGSPRQGSLASGHSAASLQWRNYLPDPKKAPLDRPYSPKDRESTGDDDNEHFLNHLREDRQQFEASRLESLEKRLTAYSSLGVIASLLVGFSLSLIFVIDPSSSDSQSWRAISKIAIVLGSLVSALNFYGVVVMGMQYYHGYRLLGKLPREPGSVDRFMTATFAIRHRAANCVFASIPLFVLATGLVLLNPVASSFGWHHALSGGVLFLTFAFVVQGIYVQRKSFNTENSYHDRHT